MYNLPQTLNVRPVTYRLSVGVDELAARLAANPADEDAKRELAQVENQIDYAAAELWGLTDSELDEIRKALELLL